MMKNRIKLTLLFALTIVVSSCNELPNQVAEIEKKAAKTEKVEKKNEENRLLEELKNTTPVNTADLEAWIPKTFGGLSLERTKSLSVFKEAQMTGWYKREKDKIIQLHITDAAGPNGTMFADKINVFGTEREFDAETQQHRSVTVNGKMARQVYETEKNVTFISFFHKKRFMIKITTFDYGIENTWNLVDELDFKVLDDLIE